MSDENKAPFDKRLILKVPEYMPELREELSNYEEKFWTKRLLHLANLGLATLQARPGTTSQQPPPPLQEVKTGIESAVKGPTSSMDVVSNETLTNSASTSSDTVVKVGGSTIEDNPPASSTPSPQRARRLNSGTLQVT